MIGPNKRSLRRADTLVRRAIPDILAEMPGDYFAPRTFHRQTRQRRSLIEPKGEATQEFLPWENRADSPTSTRLSRAGMHGCLSTESRDADAATGVPATTPPSIPENSKKFFRVKADWSLDSDGDGIADWVELPVDDTNPFLVDSDGDGVPDGEQQIPLELKIGAPPTPTGVSHPPKAEFEYRYAEGHVDIYHVPLAPNPQVSGGGSLTDGTHYGSGTQVGTQIKTARSLAELQSHVNITSSVPRWNPDTTGRNKCNIFIGHIANTANTGMGSVPIFWRYKYIPAFPIANDDWFCNPSINVDLALHNWHNNGTSFASTAEIPYPGMMVASGPSSTHGGSGHVGILDYDGAWINAGTNSVNKYIFIGDTSDTTYRPFRMRGLPDGAP